MTGRVVLLDRDGVLNRMVVDAEHGTIDSPLHEDQVHLVDGAAEACARLADAGYQLHIVSNQPAAAKGKTTLQNLEAVLARVVRDGGGARVIRSARMCVHRAEDGCACRKPRVGMLEAAWQLAGAPPRDQVWMVGDGVTDVQAGVAFGARTAFLSPDKPELRNVFADRGLAPSHWCTDLAAFANFLLRKSP